VQARSALFDLYGDHLRPRGGAAPVAALVRLLAPLDIAAPAVRTAVSRMVRQGWLRPCKLAAGPGYELTPKASVRLDDAAVRIYRTRAADWDGRWHLLVIAPPGDRTARARLSASLSFLGYGPLDGSTWIAPRRAAEIDALLAESGATAEQFTAASVAGREGAVALTRRAWNLDALAEAYQRFVAELAPVVAAVEPACGAEKAFAARSRLVHAWRAFLFTDPGLPADLLPARWPGHTAAAFFDAHARRLLPAANHFVDSCLPPPWQAPSP
jgi:phenylacetic acid degradation operon negative regulatory protein